MRASQICRSFSPQTIAIIDVSPLFPNNEILSIENFATPSRTFCGVITGTGGVFAGHFRPETLIS